MRNFLIWLLEPLHRWAMAHMQRNGMVLYCSDAPDTSLQQQAALNMSNLSAEQLEWAKELYIQTAPDRAAATARANQVSDFQLESAKTQTNLASDYAAFQKDTFRPLETGIVADAQNYNTEDRREAEASKAIGDVSQQFAAGRESQNRNMARFGINPADGAFTGAGNELMAQEALAKTFAGSKARTQVETLGAAKKMDAASLGRGLPSSQATSAGLALTAGNSSTANGMVPLNAAQSGAGIMQQGYGGAQAGLSNAANTYGAITGAASSADAANAGTMGALGSMAGTVAAVFI